MTMKIIAILSAALALVYADVYMHNPRGSNNRLDERGRERNNANRMFDSQNNNRGGYNVGTLYYYKGSKLSVEWTSQHSCGEKNADCQLIIQYMCSPDVRDGTTTRTIPEQWGCRNWNCNRDLRFGMNENQDYYRNCIFRERNKGLFTADQKLKGDTAKYTRQNPNGQRRAYECPEERDYYPYWQPTPWKDIAIMTNDVRRCEEFRKESQNVKAKVSCIPPEGYLEALSRYRVPWNKRKNLPLNKEECETIEWPVNSGIKAKWTSTPAWGIAAPACVEAPKSRDNHNGNGLGGFPNTFNWTVDGDTTGNCVVRLRYNISTADFPQETDADKNKPNNNQATKVDIASLVGLTSPDANARGYVFKNNPTVKPLSSGTNNNIGNRLNLKLAINTAQFARTFQDRSHAFSVKAAPASLQGETIHNVNVRGKRGNIVQVYPAVEYDFVPNRLHADVGDHIHIQWTGSDKNPGNNDGEGKRGQDRNNVVQLTSQNYPEGTPGKAVPENLKNGQWGNNYPAHLNAVNFLGLPKADLVNLAVKSKATTYFDLAPKKVTRPGTYYYMCSINNNFSNRNQKAKIIVGNPRTGALKADSVMAPAGIKQRTQGQNNDDVSGNGSNANVIIGGVVAGIILVVLAVAVIVYIRKR